MSKYEQISEISEEQIDESIEKLENLCPDKKEDLKKLDMMYISAIFKKRFSGFNIIKTILQYCKYHIFTKHPKIELDIENNKIEIESINQQLASFQTQFNTFDSSFNQFVTQSSETEEQTNSEIILLKERLSECERMIAGLRLDVNQIQDELDERFPNDDDLSNDDNQTDTPNDGEDSVPVGETNGEISQ